MKIVLSEQAAIKILTANMIARSREFSALGWCERKDEDVYVYDVEILDYGTSGYTTIDPTKIYEVATSSTNRREDFRVWVHKHPVNTWSAVDINNIVKTPMGGPPELIGWTVSIVLTPVGLLGRVDSFIGEHKEFQAEVELPHVSLKEMYLNQPTHVKPIAIVEKKEPKTYEKEKPWVWDYSRSTLGYLEEYYYEKDDSVFVPGYDPAKELINEFREYVDDALKAAGDSIMQDIETLLYIYEDERGDLTYESPTTPGAV